MSDTALANAAAAGPPPAPPHSGHSLWKDKGGFGFHDLLDIINPLQHLPIIGAFYRWITGARPGDVARVVGDGIYGGPIGLVAGLFNVATEDAQGRDVGERVVASVFGSESKSPAPAQPPTAVASAARPSAPASADAPPEAAAPAAAHKPIPLFGGVAQVPPTPQSGPARDPAARDFMAQTSALERQISIGRTAPPSTGAPPITAPVPLLLPPGALAARPIQVPTAPATVPAPPGQPVDISQKMLDALDKYMRLQQDRKTGPGDVAQPAAVDLSL